MKSMNKASIRSASAECFSPEERDRISTSTLLGGSEAMYSPTLANAPDLSDIRADAMRSCGEHREGMEETGMQGRLQKGRAAVTA